MPVFVSVRQSRPWSLATTLLLGMGLGLTLASAVRAEDPPPPVGAPTPGQAADAPGPTPTPAALAAGAETTADGPDPRFDAHFQATYIRQFKNAFPAEYSGGKSLSTARENSFTGSVTAYLAARLRPGTELYLDPEVIAGVPLSGLQGLGSFTNGEIQKVAGKKPKLYLPRVFVRQTWALPAALANLDLGAPVAGGESPTDPRGARVDAAANQLAGYAQTDRLVLTAGKFAIPDVFDFNGYSHDSRRQFLTWASLAHGSYDFAADAKGYTWGLALEAYHHSGWALRAGRFAAPREPNGQMLNRAIGRYYGDQVELEKRYTLAPALAAQGAEPLPGAARLLLWRNREVMARFADGLADSAADGTSPPVLDNSRRPNQKRGVGLHLEQKLTPDVGGFVRYGWADGKTEVYSFEEVDRSSQVGLAVQGLRWHRPDDVLGLLVIRNQLSGVHRDYLSAGGLGYFVGDGRLTYRPETIFEAYYNIAAYKNLWLGADAQHILNPAYNADRGPVNVFAFRAHAEF